MERRDRRVSVPRSRIGASRALWGWIESAEEGENDERLTAVSFYLEQTGDGDEGSERTGAKARGADVPQGAQGAVAGQETHV